MKGFIGKFCLTLSMAMIAATAGAVPQFDPLLRPYLNSSIETNQRVKVIAVFNDKGSPLEGIAPHSRVAAQRMEVAMRENAKASQMATVQQLMNRGNTEGSAIHMQSIWIANVLIIDMPANELKTLANNSDIRLVYANRTMHLYGPDLPSEAPPSPVQGFTYGLAKINVPQLREKAPKIDGSGVRVGILDTGIDATHPDLRGKVIMFKDFIGSKNEPYDDNSHGSHVAGTIAGGNASGTSIGIAPGAKLIVGKVFSSSGSATYEELLKAMQWIADPDGNPATQDQPMLVSNSWGGGAPSSRMNPEDDPLCKALGGWVKVGILPVFAAGNSGPGASSVGIPGACPAALAVGATDQNDSAASFSSRGPVTWKSGALIKPDVSAPGVGVLSSVPGGGYKSFSGTSMATPHTAGVAALIYQVTPNITIEAVKKLIETGAKDLGDPGQDNTFGYGRIDAFNTIKTLYSLLRSEGGPQR